MKILINTSGLTNGDIDFSEFKKMGEVEFFEEVEREVLFSLVADADALIVDKVRRGFRHGLQPYRP